MKHKHQSIKFSKMYKSLIDLKKVVKVWIFKYVAISNDKKVEKI